MDINDHILSVKAKGSIPEPLEIDKNYSVALQGTITECREKTNHNGTRDKVWVFEAVKAEVLNDLGKTIKMKDPRKLSQKLRGVMYAVNQSEDFEEYYTKNMNLLIKNWELVENYLRSII